jgi:hypothetical protein
MQIHLFTCLLTKWPPNAYAGQSIVCVSMRNSFSDAKLLSLHKSCFDQEAVVVKLQKIKCIKSISNTANKKRKQYKKTKKQRNKNKKQTKKKHGKKYRAKQIKLGTNMNEPTSHETKSKQK